MDSQLRLNVTFIRTLPVVKTREHRNEIAASSRRVRQENNIRRNWKDYTMMSFITQFPTVKTYEKLRCADW
jgi:hypothetical protein